MRSLSDFPDAHLRIFQRPEVPPASQIQDVYLIGICGTGMGSLAGLFKEAGYEVKGADEAAWPPMSTRLREMGILFHEGYDTTHLQPPPSLVITGNACTPTHPEAAYARENGLVQQSFPEALAHFFLTQKRSLVVAGTHGKTTTTGILAHTFLHAGRDPGYLIGGVMTNTGTSYRVGKGAHFVVEGDEYDSAYFDKRPKFLHYRPTSAIVTSMEYDHADIYDSWDMYREAFQQFAGIVDPTGTLALCGDAAAVRDLASFSKARVQFYGLQDEGYHVTATDIRPVEGGQFFTPIVLGERLPEMFFPMSGKHNLSNALGVLTIALAEGLTHAEISAAFASFRGLKRRQEVRGIERNVVVVDDFAHHPTAVEATIAAIREHWPNRRVVAVFEPRSNSSRRKVFEEAYAKAFDRAHHVFISAPPLRHNDDPNNFMDVNYVTQQISRTGIPAEHYPSADQLLPNLVGVVKSGDVVLIMSNGGFGGIHNKLLDAIRLNREV